MIQTDPQKIQEILTRGVEEILVKEALEKKLLSGKKLRIYYGIDPTGSLLHLGHAVVLWKLKAFADLGHEVILLIGDFTAKIGDPSGRDTTRVSLTDAEIKINMKEYKKQASKVLDFWKVEMKYNSTWLSKLKSADMLTLSSHITLKQMEQRDMFKRRIQEDAPIGIHELMYPLMQGYDSVAMDVDVEIGGNDQFFNMDIGRRLQEIYHHKDKDILAVKLLLGTDGRKMSKTYDNAIYLTDAPNEMFGKIMSINDELIGDYLELATQLSQSEITVVKNLPNPRDQKARLAFEIVKIYHGEDSAKKAEEEFNKTFRDKDPDFKKFQYNERQINILDLLVELGLAPSKNEAKRLILQKAVKINGETQEDWQKIITTTAGMKIQVGPRKFLELI